MFAVFRLENVVLFDAELFRQFSLRQSLSDSKAVHPLTSASPAPMTPGAITTEAWAYEENGRWEQVEGEWIHLPAHEGAELLLWIEHAEELCR